MGYREISLKLPTDYTEDDLRKRIGKELHLQQFTFQTENKSLDARNKNSIHWLLRVAVFSPELKGESPEENPTLVIPYRKRKEKVLVTGSGPAGFFAAYVLQKAGFQTTLIERGTEVDKRAGGIRQFEKTGVFNPASNYAFGEGGAGTFSDGKLTSRSKHISTERQFILSAYVNVGAPKEIEYMTHPHVGSDNLKIIVKNLRDEFRRIGGTLLFETMLQDVHVTKNKITGVLTSRGELIADIYFIAPGHSAFETYRMLMKRGIPFRTKNFAIGYRVEHPQEIINRAQWGKKSLPGVKAAEYRLTFNNGNLPVYTFCMCPGGTIVPATAYEHTNIVNGMSLFQRDGRFANAACVAGINPCQLLNREITPPEVLDWLEQLEMEFYTYSSGYAAPFCRISDFINQKDPSGTVESSYPMGLSPAPLWNMLPLPVSNAIRDGLKDFSRKVKGFETGSIMGLESKTSSPVQVVRDPDGKCSGIENLYIVGEGSGYAGGIISSAADGIRAAMGIIGS